MTTKCPVCGLAWTALPLRCFCDYEFETGSAHVAIVRFAAERRRASRRGWRGLAMVFAIPVTFALGLIDSSYLLLATLLAGAQLVAGVLLMFGGFFGAFSAGRQLAAAKKLHGLPEARVVRSS